MILSDKEVLSAKAKGDIVIEPFDDGSLGPNSYDVHLGDTLLTYAAVSGNFFQRLGRMITGRPRILDAAMPNDVREHKIPRGGFVLKPNVLYLASSVEYTATQKYVPFLDGKSSIGRLGMWIHCTAGRGDVGFANHWTMEIVVVHPLRVYAGMPVGQLIYFLTGEVLKDYATKGGTYNDRDPHPQPSRLWRKATQWSGK